MNAFDHYYVIQHNIDGSYICEENESYQRSNGQRFSVYLWSARPFDSSKEGLEMARSLCPKDCHVAVVSSRRL